jgi:hypothetical protein
MRSCRELRIPVLLTGLLICPAILVYSAESAELAIKVDQVGYPLHDPKVALVGGPAETFEIRRPSRDGVVFRSKLATPETDPRAGRQDALLAALPGDLPPAKVYADRMESYASNEIAINWQASLVFLLAGQLR